jgi:hypothetical protein
LKVGALNPRSGEWVAAISGLGLLAVMFAGWYQPTGGTALTAWESFTVIDWIIAVAALTALIVGVISIAGVSVSLPVAGSAITSLLGVIAFVLIVMRLIFPPEDMDRELGAWLGLLWSAGILLGAYIGMEEEPV